MKTTIFSELHMTRDNENIGYDWSLIEDICDASGIDISEFRDENGNNISGLIYQWYSEHRARGGAPDPVMEDIIVEAKLETTFGSMGDNPGKA
jgi:hypothetical protein